ncbi:MAG: hypothetical protein R3B48_18625 [Kofleriaceae bacterium]
MPRPGSILELPFARRPLFDLLGFEEGRAHVDVDYAGFGWATPARLWLDGGAATRCVERPLVLALHSGAATASAKELTLEFWLPPEEGDEERDPAPIAVPLAAFLERWLPALPLAGPIVLALCNPGRLAVAHPRAAGARPLHYAVGDVESWLELDDGVAGGPGLAGEDELAAGGRFRLAAEAWHVTSPGGEVASGRDPWQARGTHG